MKRIERPDGGGKVEVTVTGVRDIGDVLALAEMCCRNCHVDGCLGVEQDGDGFQVTMPESLIRACLFLDRLS